MMFRDALGRWRDSLLGWLGRHAPRVHVLGLHWVIPVALLLHGGAALWATTVPVTLHSIPQPEGLGSISLWLGVTAAVIWTHSQWRDRPTLPLGIAQGVAWTPIVALIIVVAFVSPAATASWMLANRIRALREEPAFAVAAKTAPDGMLFEGGPIEICSHLRDLERRKQETTWVTLDPFTRSGNARKTILEGCAQAASSGVVSDDAAGALARHAMFFRAQTEGRSRIRGYRRAYPLAAPLRYEDPRWLSVIGVACTACANIACLGGLLSRALVLRWTSVLLACLSVPLLFALDPRTGAPHLSQVAGGLLVVAMISVVVALVRGRRSTGTDIGLVALFFGCPWLLMLAALLGAMPFKVDERIPIACGIWSFFLSVALWALGDRYRTMPVEDGVLEAAYRRAEPLLGTFRFLTSRRPGLALSLPMSLVPTAFVFASLVAWIAFKPGNSTLVRNPRAHGDALLTACMAVGVTWLALQQRLRGQLPLGSRVGLSVGPLPGLAIIGMFLAGGQIAERALLSETSAAASDPVIWRAVMDLSFEGEGYSPEKLAKHMSLGDLRPGTNLRTCDVRTSPCLGIANPPKIVRLSPDIADAMGRLGGYDKVDVREFLAACQRGDNDAALLLMNSREARVREIVSSLRDARSPSESLERRSLSSLQQTPASSLLLMLGAAIVLLSALASVVRPEEATKAVTALLVTGSVAGALITAPHVGADGVLVTLTVVAVLACVAVVRDVRRRWRSPWTDRCLVIVVLSVPLAAALTVPKDYWGEQHVNIHRMKIAFFYANAAWIGLMTVLHRLFAQQYRDLPFGKD